MEDKKKFELNDEALDNVTGGSFYDEPGTEFMTCTYCMGYIIYKRNYVKIPNEQVRCLGCGYMPAFPETAPSHEDVIGG